MKVASEDAFHFNHVLLVGSYWLPRWLSEWKVPGICAGLKRHCEEKRVAFVFGEDDPWQPDPELQALARQSIYVRLPGVGHAQSQRVACEYFWPFLIHGSSWPLSDHDPLSELAI